MLSREESDLAEPERRLRVLVADDVEDNRLLIRLLLRKRPVDLTMASDGMEAVDAVRSGEPFDLILMDVEMPRMDGLEAGCDAHMTKPILKSDLLAALGADTPDQAGTS